MAHTALLWYLPSVVVLAVVNVDVAAWMSVSTRTSGTPPKALRLYMLFSPTSDPIATLQGPWNVSDFAATECWGRKPLLLKGAFATAGLRAPSAVSWEDISNLAIDDGEEEEPPTSRIIQHQPGTLDTYQVEFGPFSQIQLEEYLENNNDQLVSTLVVNDVDRYYPILSDWIDETFSFLPRWRRDDAQVSLAKRGGGIGPHVDNYDVFLIQASGSRDWVVGLEEISVEDEFAHLVEESQVRILNLPPNSMTTVKCRLVEGDCLYLPPRILHWGTSTTDDCVTLSVGCRSPSAADLLSRMAEFMATSTTSVAVARYSDWNLLEDPSSVADGRISDSVKADMKKLLVNLVEQLVDDEDAFGRLIGKLVTEPNRPVMDYPTALSAMDGAWQHELGRWGSAEESVAAMLRGEGVLRRAEGVSFAWSRDESDVYRLYAQGRSFTLNDPSHQAGDLLCRITRGAPLDSACINHGSLPESLKKLVAELVEEGFLYGEDNDNIDLQ